MRINLNGGWLRDRDVDRQYLTYGLRFDWNSPGRCSGPSKPSARLALRIARVSSSRDRKPAFATVPMRSSRLTCYGRNITGENANWITLGTTVRFPVEGRPARERTDHL
jgi:hypothetical protein